MMLDFLSTLKWSVSYLQAVSEMRAQLNEKCFELEVLKLSPSIVSSTLALKLFVIILSDGAK